MPTILGHRNRLAEPLLLEVSDRIVIGVGQEIFKTFDLCMSLQVVHQDRSETFDLFHSTYSTESDFTELLFTIWTIADTTYDTAVQKNRKGFMPFIEYEADDIIPRHLRQLLRKNIF
jgi:hypothetical protein